MKRYHEEKDRTRRQHIKHLRQLHGWPVKPVTCICDLQAGRFRKKHPLGCGKSRCYICKGEKLLNRKTLKDKIRDLIFKENMADVV